MFCCSYDKVSEEDFQVNLMGKNILRFGASFVLIFVFIGVPVLFRKDSFASPRKIKVMQLAQKEFPDEIPSTKTEDNVTPLTPAQEIKPDTSVPPVKNEQTEELPQKPALMKIQGKGSFYVARGQSEVSGKGTVKKFMVAVESVIDESPAEFASSVESLLFNEKGWTAKGKVALQRVDNGAADFFVLLAVPKTVNKLCYPLRTAGYYSCRAGKWAVINYARWMKGAPPAKLPLPQYRMYVVNHEVGHALGYSHRRCPGRHQPAPVMMQQSKSIGACAPNPFPFP